LAQATAESPPQLRELARRALPQGGFPAFPGGVFCPAATAWTLLALPGDDAAAASACERLCRAVQGDGLLPVAPAHPDAVWPAAPALMALAGQASAQGQVRALAERLLGSSGQHWPVSPGAAVDHDTSLRGWSWTSEAHSWVEPTALTMLALSAAGHSGHPRLHEARNLLMDRQMPGGGWNYGNVRVYGALLHPDPVNTGAALCALKGRAEAGTVAASLDYLERVVRATRAPLSLSWALLALGAWGRPGLEPFRQALAVSVVQHEADAVLGPLETGALALACIALESPDGLAAHLLRRSSLHDG